MLRLSSGTIRPLLYILFILLVITGAFCVGQWSQQHKQLPLRQAIPVENKVHKKQKSLPASGAPAQFGVYANDFQTVEALNSDIGAGSLQLIGLFEHWKPTGITNVNKLRSACSSNITPLISWESSGDSNNPIVYNLLDIAAGMHDTLILQYLDQLQNICKDTGVIIRFNHEMEMRPTYSYAWSDWQGKPNEYIQAWRHVVTLARSKHLDTIKWLWSPNRADEHVYAYYPGSEYVDYVGITLNHPTIVGNVYDSFEQFYAPNKTTLESFGKPIIIGETAYYNADEQQIARWIDGTFSYAKTDGHIVGMVWFNQTMGHLDYSLSATKAGREAFIRNMQLLRK